MLFSTFAALAFFGLTQATPTPKDLSFDDMLFLREDGNHVVMKKWDYQIEEDKREVQRRKAIAARGPAPPAVARISERCDESTEIQVLSDTSFTDWDVAMSPVIGNTGSTTATVAIAKGYSVADAVSVTETAAAKLDEVFTVSLSIAYTYTYTTTDTQTFTFYVPAGQYGVVISNPWLRRVSGNVLSGCTDSPTVDPFESNSYTSQSFGGNLDWVKGPITMCNTTTYPIPYCVGTGVHE